MPSSPNFIQQHFRFRTDGLAVDDAGVTWGAAEDVNYYPGTDTNFRIRFAIDNTGTGGGNSRFLLYSLNSGSYTQVTTSSSVIRSVDASTSADNASIATANFRLTAGTGTAQSGQYDETGSNTITLTNGFYTECEYGIVLRSADVAAGDLIDLRMYETAGTPFTSYTRTPRITVPGSFRFRNGLNINQTPTRGSFW
jgi:hypothetical protein